MKNIKLRMAIWLLSGIEYKAYPHRSKVTRVIKELNTLNGAK